MINLQGYKRKNDLTFIKGVIYGPEVKENILVSLKYNEFEKVFDECGRSQIINLKINDVEYEVLVKEFQLHPVSDKFIHVDFYVVKKGQEVEVGVPVEFIGESMAVKLGNILMKACSELMVKSLPKNIPTKIEVDISVLENVNDVIRLEDLKLAEGVEFLTKQNSDVVASVSAPVEEVRMRGEGEGEIEKEDPEKKEG